MPLLLAVEPLSISSVGRVAHRSFCDQLSRDFALCRSPPTISTVRQTGASRYPQTSLVTQHSVEGACGYESGSLACSVRVQRTPHTADRTRSPQSPSSAETFSDPGGC